MSTSRQSSVDEIRSHEHFVVTGRIARHTDSQQLRELTRRAADSTFTELDELTAQRPKRRPPKRHTPSKARRYGRNRSRLAHWKTKSWKRRSVVSKQKALAGKEAQDRS